MFFFNIITESYARGINYLIKFEEDTRSSSVVIIIGVFKAWRPTANIYLANSINIVCSVVITVLYKTLILGIGFPVSCEVNTFNEAELKFTIALI